MRNVVHIEPFRPADEAACYQLLKRVYGEDGASRSYYRLAPKRTLIAVAQDRVVGLASTWENPHHPFAPRSGVVVCPRYRRRSVGAQLWEALVATCTEARSLVTSLWETQLTGHQFALRHGYVEIRRTYTMGLRIGDVALGADPAALDDDMMKQGYFLVPYPDMSRPERAQMAELLRHTYAATHQANPVRDFSGDEWYALAFPDDLLLWGSFAVMYGDVCVAAALLHKGPQARHVDLGWRGVAEAHRHQSRAFMVMATAHQIAAAAERGFVKVSLECDSTDPCAREVLDSFPFGPAPAWITLRRDQ